MTSLSFSIPEMKPLIKRGLQQLQGLKVNGRVKRQTIRKINCKAGIHNPEK